MRRSGVRTRSRAGAGSSTSSSRHSSSSSPTATSHPSIRTPFHSPQALKRLREAALLREAGLRRRSARGYEFLRRVELRLRIVHDYAVDHLPRGRGLPCTSSRAASATTATDPGARFAAEYQRVTAAVRTAFEEVVR